MEKIKEKPALSERIKEKAVSTPRELLRKGLDDGSERLRTQLRDTAQHGQADEYGVDTIEDTAARGLRRAEKELTRQRKKKQQEQPPEGGAPAADVTEQKPSAIKGKDTTSAGSQPQSAAERGRQQARQNAAKVKAKDTYIGAQTETQVTVAAEPQRQGQQAFIRERGRRVASQQQRRQRQERQRILHRNEAPHTNGFGCGSTESKVDGLTRGSKIKERNRIQSPKNHQAPLPRELKQTASSLPKTRESSKLIGRVPEQTARSTATSASMAGVQTAREAAEVGRYQRTAKAAQAAIQKTTQTASRALRAIIAAAQNLLAAIAAGGSTAVAMVLVICLIGLLIVSPFGIFFSGEDSGTGYTMPEAVSVLNGEFAARIEQIKAENPYDELDMDNAGSAAMISNWRDVLAVYAVRTTTDNASPDEVATLTEEKMEILREIFWDMNTITYWTEIVPGGKDEADTVILHITVTIKTHLQMADEHQFNTEQRRLLEELMQPKYQELFMVLTGSYQDIELSPDEVAKIIENLPADLSENRKQVVLTAYQLLGKVHYFWGGKSLIIGWDSRWGMPMKVTAEGSSTTGTVRPFGLDCSGMVDWVFYNQSGGQYVIGHGGGATAQHSYCAPIAWSDAKPGDLVFYPGNSHVGIVCGFDSSGNIMVIHCASSENNVVVTGKSGFTSIGRPEYFAD